MYIYTIFAKIGSSQSEYTVQCNTVASRSIKSETFCVVITVDVTLQEAHHQQLACKYSATSLEASRRGTVYSRALTRKTSTSQETGYQTNDKSMLYNSYEDNW